MNPFADVGETVTGERFVGRRDELRLIESRVFGEGGFGSLAIIGLPRIGKTSVVTEALRRSAVRLEQQKALVIGLDVGVFASVEELFTTLVKEILEACRHHGWSNDVIETRASRALDTVPLSFYEVRTLCRAVRQAGIRPVVVLDEFDAGRYLFSGMPQSFHWLRELSSNPEFKIALIVLSKRRLQDVARIAGQESDYWANVLMTITLRSFSDDDRTTFFERLRRAGLRIDDITMAEVAAVCGRHPFLLDLFAYHAWEGARIGQALGTDWFRSTMGSAVRDYFQQAVSILRDGPMLGKAVQVIAGPQWDVCPDDVHALVEYGVLESADGNKLRGFSNGFEDYLRSSKDQLKFGRCGVTRSDL